MSNVIQFKPRTAAQARPVPADVRPQPAREHKGPAIQATAGDMPAISEPLKHLEEQGTAMQVLSALLFYAHQGFDDGKRARRAVVAMQELLGGAPEAA